MNGKDIHKSSKNANVIMITILIVMHVHIDGTACSSRDCIGLASVIRECGRQMTKNYQRTLMALLGPL